MDKLARLFPDAAFEKQPADILDPDATIPAVEGCDLVYDCIGLPGDQMRMARKKQPTAPLSAYRLSSGLRFR